MDSDLTPHGWTGSGICYIVRSMGIEDCVHYYHSITGSACTQRCTLSITNRAESNQQAGIIQNGKGLDRNRGLT